MRCATLHGVAHRDPPVTRRARSGDGVLLALSSRMAWTVLIVDPDRKARMSLKGLVERAGYRTLCAEGLPAATRLLQAQTPDILVTEIRLDGYNGLHLIAAAPEPIPAVVVTAYADPAIEMDARRFGAEYLARPVDADALLGAMARQLARGRGDTRFTPARYWPRIAVRDIILVDLAGRSAQVRNVSEGGACLDLHTRTATGPLPLRRDDVVVTAHLAWERQIAPRRWRCGVQVTSESAARWSAIVEDIISTDAQQYGLNQHVVSFFPVTRRLRHRER